MHHRHVCVQRRRNLLNHNDDDNNRVSTKEIGEEETRCEIGTSEIFYSQTSPLYCVRCCNVFQKFHHAMTRKARVFATIWQQFHEKRGGRKRDYRGRKGEKICFSEKKKKKQKQKRSLNRLA